MTTIRNIAAASVLTLGLAGSVFGLAGWTNAEARPAATTITAAEGGRHYDVDNTHSSVNFKILHARVANFYGRFNDFKGTIIYDKDDISNSSITFEVTVKSVDTNSRTRDGHLRNADFFNARQFPKATFSSASITETGDGKYEITGKLELRGITKTITATMTDFRSANVQGEDKIGFDVHFSIKRGDYEINKYLAPDGSDDGPLGNTVDLLIAIEAIAQ